MLNQRLAGSHKCRAEKRPTDKSGQNKYEYGTSPGPCDTRNCPKHKRQNARCEKRLENDPRDAKQGLPVPKLDVPDGEGSHESAKIPELTELESIKPCRGTDTKVVAGSHLRRLGGNGPLRRLGRGGSTELAEVLVLGKFGDPGF